MVLAVLVTTACATMPASSARHPSTSLGPREARDTGLGRALAASIDAHPGLSGVVALREPGPSLAARLQVIESAERTLDIQYYIWHDNRSGRLVFDAIDRAADRGVRVRLLLDDNNTIGLDARLRDLNEHPNIEVRLFNPFMQRRWRWAGYLTDFSRLNRRMHNKSLSADSQITIVGGRNIGDEYFGRGEQTEFIDLDVMAVGPVVRAVVDDFDRYWSSDSSYPFEQIVPDGNGHSRPPSGKVFTGARPVDRAVRGSRGGGSTGSRSNGRGVVDIDVDAIVRDHRPLTDAIEGRGPFEWAKARLVSDDPLKGLGKADDAGLLARRAQELIGSPHATWYIVSPYFVSSPGTLAIFRGLEDRGVQVTVLTNALAATDVAAVHAGYADTRAELLRAGVELFELKPYDPDQRRRRREQRRDERRGMLGTRSASLHAKAFAVDGQTVFVGSFNFDPRSRHLNTELGMIIESPGMARQLEQMFREQLADTAYRLQLSGQGELEWVERVRDGPGSSRVVIHHQEPATSWWQRAWVGALSWLPIRSLL